MTRSLLFQTVQHVPRTLFNSVYLELRRRAGTAIFRYLRGGWVAYHGQAMVALMAMLFQNGTVGTTGPAMWLPAA